MIDNSWVLGIVMTFSFSIAVIAILIKLLSWIFPKKEKKNKVKEGE